MTACSGHPTALISVCALFICNSSSPFIGRSGIPGDGSRQLVSWAVMDTGGQRKCLHGWDQSTVLGLMQRPWRLIISPQKCSFMLLILCKLVSDFSVQAIFPPLAPSHHGRSQWQWVWSETYWTVISTRVLQQCLKVTILGRMFPGRKHVRITPWKIYSGWDCSWLCSSHNHHLIIRLSYFVWEDQSAKYKKYVDQ